VDLNHYRFRSEWHLNAPASKVFVVLEALETYPAWWPEIRIVETLGPDRSRITARSWLPYDLRFDSRQARRDREAGVLEASMIGDLEGFSRWTLQPNGPTATTAVFEEEVVTNKALLRRLAFLARPAFRANHTLMMKHGEKGLRAYLAGHLREFPNPI
jgi:hypothetical protein